SPYNHTNVTSVILHSGGSTFLSIQGNSDRRLVRALRYSPANEICNNHLKQIRFAKDLWVMEQHRSSVDWPNYGDIFPGYIRERPSCPQGGYYSLSPAYAVPICSVPDHVLEEPP